MNEQDLFHAIGGAEDAFLAELEASPSPRRLPRRFGLIAAMLALLLTACAPAVLQTFDKLTGGNIVESETDLRAIRGFTKDGEILYGETVYTSGAVSLKADRSENAPDTIQTCYLPQRLLDFCTVEDYTLTDTTLSVSFSMKGPEHTRIQDVFYQQHVLPPDGCAEVTDLLSRGAWNQTFRDFDAIRVLQIAGVDMGRKAVGTDSEGNTIYEKDPNYGIAFRYFFWSDGDYLYCLKLPFAPPLTRESRYQDIITSLTPITSLSEFP